MSTATIRAGVDSWTGSNEGNTNRGGASWLVVRDDGSITNYSYVWLKSPAPAGATILSAHLTLIGQGSWGSKSIRVRPIEGTWKESQITFNNAPDVRPTGTSDTLTASNVDGQAWTFDVTGIVQAIADGQANYGFRVASTVQSAAIARFYSLEAASGQPTLTVEWADAPAAPHTLSPSGGRAAATDKPVLRFDYTDVSGSVKLAAVQVQVNNNANQFLTPTFDSGTVATTDPQLDLAATSYVGLAAGDNAWWRVRVQDAAGLWSDWSDPAQFTHADKGVLSITNPPLGGTVTDVTPPIIWALSGATQSQWRVQIRPADDPTTFLHDSGWRAGTASTYTLPNGVLKDQAETYRAVVHVRDTVDRESTPGDPVEYGAGQDFTFTESGTVAHPTGLAAASDPSGRPWVLLTWSRSAAPDQFLITRDGITVARVAAADVSAGGTGYAYSDRQAGPGTEHTWKVAAIVNGVTSNANPTIDFTYTVDGAWLTDLDTDRNVPISFPELSGWEEPEISSTLEPVGSDTVVRIVQKLRGPQATLAGRVVDGHGQSTAYWANNLRIMKKSPMKVYRLVLGQTNIGVLIGNVTVQPVRGLTGKAVSFDFWSIDGPE